MYSWITPFNLWDCRLTFLTLQLKESMDEVEEDDYIDGDDYEFDDPPSEEDDAQ